MTISFIFMVIFFLLSIYSIIDIASSIYLVLRYEQPSSSFVGFMLGETLFTVFCLTCSFWLFRLTRKYQKKV